MVNEELSPPKSGADLCLVGGHNSLHNNCLFLRKRLQVYLKNYKD